MNSDRPDFEIQDAMAARNAVGYAICSKSGWSETDVGAFPIWRMWASALGNSSWMIMRAIMSIRAWTFLRQGDFQEKTCPIMGYRHWRCKSFSNSSTPFFLILMIVTGISWHKYFSSFCTSWIFSINQFLDPMFGWWSRSLKMFPLMFFKKQCYSKVNR